MTEVVSEEQLVSLEARWVNASHLGWADATVRALVGEVRASHAREAELRAEVKQLTDDYVPMVGNDMLRIDDDGTVHLKMTGAKVVVNRIAEAMTMMLDEQSATNYIEMDAIREDGRRFTLRVQRYECPTPHQLRQQFEAERDVLQQRVVALAAEVESLDDYICDLTMLGDSVVPPVLKDRLHRFIDRRRAVQDHVTGV